MIQPAAAKTTISISIKTDWGCHLYRANNTTYQLLERVVISQTCYKCVYCYRKQSPNLRLLWGLWALLSYFQGLKCSRQGSYNY